MYIAIYESISYTFYAAGSTKAAARAAMVRGLEECPHHERQAAVVEHPRLLDPAD
jgi:hypothetical protein